MFAREIHKDTFSFIVLLRDQKYQKSFKRIFHPLKNLLPRARVSRASHAWRVSAAKDRAKVGSFIAPRNLILPRVRTYHTRKPSRFVHALPARPLKVHGGRGSGTCADENRDFCQPSPVGEGGARSVTDEVSFVKKT